MENIVNLSFAPLVKGSFYAFLLMYSIFTFIIYYHWQNYATDARMTRLTLASYFIITIPLVACLAVLTFLIL